MTDPFLDLPGLIDKFGLVAALLAFAACGLVILLSNPPPPRFSLLITPILLYAVASAIYVFSTPNAAFTAVVAHSGVWLITQAALYDRARKGCP